MKISSNQIRLWLLALTAFSLTTAEVVADILSNKTPEQTNSKESLRDSTADPETDSVDLMRQLSVQEKVEQMGQNCPAISDLAIPAYNWWSEGTNGYQAPDAYFVQLPPARANDPGVTVFPQAIALAATWDPVLHQQVGEVTSTEARERYNWYTAAHQGDSVHDTGVTVWAPNINIFRDPRWGRGQETYGEDPYLTGTMATAYVEGLQGWYPEQPSFLKTVATLKHFAVHSGPEVGRRAMDTVISEHDLRETYLPAFEAGIRIGKAQSIMSSYNAIGVTGTAEDAKNNPVGGIPAPANSMLLTDILRKEWGFTGAVVSDVGAITAIWQDHHYENSPATASVAAIEAGNDLCGDGSIYNSILDPNSATGLVNGITVKRDIDPALLRLLTLRFRLGLFDPSSQWPSGVPTDPHDAIARTSPLDSERIKRDALALKAAEESLVLLKNDFAAAGAGEENSALPWQIKAGETIAVIGPTMDILPAILGDYSGFPIKPVTILQGITDYFTKSLKYQPFNVKVVSEPAVSLPDAPQPNGDEAGIQRAVNLVKTADHVVLVVGLTTHLEREESGMVYEGINNGDRTTLQLPLEEQKLLAAVKEACDGARKSLTVVLTSGGGLAIDATKADAIMQAWYCGSQGGTAVAEALAGDINPSGKLPITFYAADGDLPKFEDYAMAPHPALQPTATTPAFPESKGRTYRYFTGKPEYAFGYGLSYTTFKYYPDMSIENGSSAIMIPKDTRLKDDPKNYVNVSVNIANMGPRAGTEIVELYATPSFSCPSPSIEPKQKLVGFQRCMLETTEVKKVTIPVNLQELRRWDDATHKYKIDPGTYLIYARTSSDTPNEKSASCRLTLASE
jgi:beta-glucosidase